MTRAPRRLKEQVRDTVTELPVHAARFAVMGVGRALLLTDRVRKDYREARKSGLGPVLGRLKDDAENLTGMVVGRVAGRAASNGQAEETPKRDTEISVGKPKATPAPRPTPTPTSGPPPRPATTSRPAPKPASKPSAARTTAPKSKPKSTTPKTTTAKTTTAKTTATPKSTPKKPTPAKTSTADLPVTGYDDATLASVRARLRGLDARQVGQLRDYERSNAARADFLRMYENRIAKLRGTR
jgi:hypothetical protein